MNTFHRIVLVCCTMCVTVCSSLSVALAAEKVVVSGTDKIIGKLLQPVANFFAGNAWLQGGSVICVTFIVASTLTWFIFRLIMKLTEKTTKRIDDTIARLARPPIYYSLLATGISTGLNLMPLSAKFLFFSSRCIPTIGLIIWIYFFIRLASIVLTRMAQLADEHAFIQGRTLSLFDNGAKMVIFSVGLYLFFVIWHIDMTAWLASAGIAGIAIGFAAKDTLSNLFAGVFILADAPYKVGDYIVLGTDRGKVLQIGLRSTRMLTRDDVEIIIPNSIIGNSTIINQTGGPYEHLRLRLKIGVAYGTDIDLVRKLLLEIAAAEPLVLKKLEPKVRFRAFGASSLDFELLCWAGDPELRGRTIDVLNCAVYKAFNAHNIEIPYAKQDIYIKNWPATQDAPKDMGAEE